MAVRYQIQSPQGVPVSAKGGTQVIGATFQPAIRCPHCMKEGVFRTVNNQSDLVVSHQQAVAGQMRQFNFITSTRICPNAECQGVLFVVHNGVQLIFLAPPEVMDFDASGLPERLSSTLEEAIKCHAASCYRAAALMVRRLLEEICLDKNATGNDLKARLKALGSAVVIPAELLEAADHLRLLGNDAAHIEAKTYDSIGAEEVSVAIALAKEILKGVYQYAGLVEKLKQLAKPQA